MSISNKAHILRPAATDIELATPFTLTQKGLAKKRRQNQNANAPVVILLHPPRTGGTTVHFNLNALNSERNIPYTRFRVAKKFSPPSLTVKNWTGAWETIEDTCPEVFDALNDIPKDMPLFMSGHFPHGVHETLNYYMSDRPVEYIGIVRDPVAREISTMNYQIAHNGMSPDTYTHLIDNEIILDNAQTRMYAGHDAMLADKCTDEIFQTAVHNLVNGFNIVAGTSQVNEMMRGIVTWYGLPAIAYHNANLSPQQTTPNIMPESTVAKLADYHKYDMALHTHAVAAWSRWKQDNTAPDTPNSIDETQTVMYVPRDYNQTRKHTSVKLQDLLL